MNDMEHWELLDGNGLRTGEIIKSGDFIPQGRYHLVGAAWIQNSSGQFLVSQRHPNKNNYPYYWECTGGSALAGEDSLHCAIREAKEELGLDLSPNGARLLYRVRRESLQDFYEAWIFYRDISIDRLVLQETEVIGAKWVSGEELREMYKKKILHPYLEYIIKIGLI